MARTKPFAIKPRRPNRTVLAVGEGETEKAFLNYLKSIYNTRDNGVSVKIVYAGGGSPECVIGYAVKMNPKNYDESYIIMDKDLTCRPAYRRKAASGRIEIIWCEPCIEAVFLRILGKDINPAIHDSQHCKRTFEQNYLDENKKLVPEEYAQIFPRELLEERRGHVRELDAMICLMTASAKEKKRR